MNPINTPNSSKENCNPVSSNCVIWQGPDLDCISLCKGDSITIALKKTAELICLIQDEIDVTGIDLDCLSDNCTGCPICSDEQKTLKNLLTCLVNKFCELETTVAGITPGEPGEATPLNVDVDCVEAITGTTLTTNPTDDQIVQLIIDGVCKNDETIQTILTTIVTIQNDCCGEGGGGGGVTDVTYLDCNSVIQTVPIATIIQELKTEQCDLREDVGLEADVDTALSKQCDNVSLLALLGLSFTQAQNLGQSEAHQWDILCAMVTKLTEVEALQKECCQPDCSDINMQVIGSIVDDGSGNKTFSFIFTFDGSTTVPFSGTDCGSVITLTDSNGNTQLINNVLLDDDATWTGVPVNPILNLTGDIDISVQSCLEFAEFNLKCVNCIKGLIPVISNCDYCTITIAGTDINLNISYLNGGITSTVNVSTTGTQTKQIIIPGTAVIQAVVLNSGTLTSITNDAECPGLVITLDDVKLLKCYRVNIAEDFWETSLSNFYNIVGIWNAGVQEVVISDVRSDLTATRIDLGVGPTPIRLFHRPTSGIDYVAGTGATTGGLCETIQVYHDDGSLPNLSVSVPTLSSDIVSSGSLIVTGLEDVFLTNDRTTTLNSYSTIIVKAVEGLTQLYLELEMNSPSNDINAVKPRVLLSFTEIVDCDVCT